MINKDDIIKNIAASYDLTKKEANEIVDSVFEQIILELEKGEIVRIADFGKFEIRNRNSRIGVNPITKGPISIKSMKAISFHSSLSVRNRINKDR